VALALAAPVPAIAGICCSAPSNRSSVGRLTAACCGPDAQCATIRPCADPLVIQLGAAAQPSTDSLVYRVIATASASMTPLPVAHAHRGPDPGAAHSARSLDSTSLPLRL